MFASLSRRVAAAATATVFVVVSFVVVAAVVVLAVTVVVAVVVVVFGVAAVLPTSLPSSLLSLPSFSFLVIAYQPVAFISVVVETMLRLLHATALG